MSASQPNLAFAARAVLLDGSVDGLRIIDSFGSILRVSAAPFSELGRMKRHCDVSGYVTYVIDAPLVYTGHGESERNIGDRLDQEAKESSQVYVIFSLDPRLDKSMTSCLEALLIDKGCAMGVPFANCVRPFGRDGLAPSADREQLFGQALILLSIAGFRRFEDAQKSSSDRPLHLLATSQLNDVQVLDPEAMAVPADVARMRLKCRDLEAEGYTTAGGRFRVLPGAHYSFTSKSGLSNDNRARRRAIEQREILGPPDAVGRARLRVGLDCKSAAMAAKILTGEHIGTAAWQPTITSEPNLIDPGSRGAARLRAKP
jgi:hypothetical protein